MKRKSGTRARGSGGISKQASSLYWQQKRRETEWPPFGLGRLCRLVGILLDRASEVCSTKPQKLGYNDGLTNRILL